MNRLRESFSRNGSPSSLVLSEAARVTATGDLWLFTGRSAADKAIRAATNSPVNHVGMVISIDDLPPLLWHAELGASLTDVWAGEYQRGAQLHRLTHAVEMWFHRYGQRAYFRQLNLPPSFDAAAITAMENAALASVEKYDGKRFPKPSSLATRWVLGRARRSVPMEDLYCAELVALTMEAMGLLEGRRPANWYDPGKFWSGDRLELTGGAYLGREISVDVPPPLITPWKV